MGGRAEAAASVSLVLFPLSEVNWSLLIRLKSQNHKAPVTLRYHGNGVG